MEELSPVKRALLEVRTLRAKLESLAKRQGEPVAIVGAGLRLPGGVDSLHAYWELLRSGLDVVTETPPERWDNDQIYDADFRTPGKVSTRYGAFLGDVDKFDPAFFGISPREAESMDPQHRLLLEVASEALERSGHAAAELAGSQAGVFLGISNSDYQRLMLSDLQQIDPYVSTGNLFSVAAGRLSYILGLHGPNISLDTACSSSLVALHLAVQSLRQRECDLALVGGVSLMLSPAISVNFSKAQMMAPDGRCKTFDAAADGYVRGEGCIVVVLKRLDDALADRDLILGVVRGTAINHDGRSGGLTAPNGPAQTAVIRRALENAGVSPDAIGYVETHGTGTSLGDPIEVRALVDALAKGRSADNPLRIGSVKTNIGHTEAAAGLAGLLKVLLAMQHGHIPPHLHLTKLNPHITLGGAPVEIPTALTAWEPQHAGGRLLAGVSSFGLSGTNAHVVLEQAPLAPALDITVLDSSPADLPLHVLPLSAQTAPALGALVERYNVHLATHDEVSLADICYTAGAGRNHWGRRLAVVAGTTGEAQEQLAAYVNGQRRHGIVSGQTPAGAQPDITFLYTGHGANYMGMGRQLYDGQPVFRAALDACDALTRPLLEHSLLAALYPDLAAGAPLGLLEQMTYAQVALFSLQYALTQLWQSWGVMPALVMGHSAGEYAAAAVAGVFDLADSLKLVLARGQLMESPGMAGTMAAVFADAERVEPILERLGGQVAIAGYNGPNNVVISGAATAVDEALQALAAARIKSRRLPIAQAAHSPLLEPLLPAFEQQVAGLQSHAPRLGLVSSVTGELATTAQLTSAAYWRAHLRRPVRFEQAMKTLHGLGQRVFVEIGPRPMLLALGQRCVPADTGVWVPSLREAGQDWRQMMESLAVLYTQGAAVDWQGVYGGPRQRVDLPTYPFQRKRYWTSIQPSEGAAIRGVDGSTPVTVDPIATWENVCAAAAFQAGQAPLDLAPATYGDKWESLRALSSAYMLAALQELGGFPSEAQPQTVEALAERWGVTVGYRGLLGRWLKRLAAEGALVAVDEAFAAPHAAEPQPDPDLPALRRQARALLADAPMIFEYVERCGPRLAGVLTGTVRALDTLFPGGSSALAEALYQEWSVSRYFAHLMRAALQAFVTARASGRTAVPLRILEVGAGTGATTASLLPILAPERTLYEFTDVSDLFLGRAESKFAAYGFVRYGRLDLEQTPSDQGYAAGSYDVIVATNVLHATTNLHRTLDHVYGLLAPGGLLLINEGTEHLAWFDITTGLIEGWQRFDDDLRHEQPLLDAETWQRALSAHGFASVAAWPAAASPAAVLGQRVFAAIKSGGGDVREIRERDENVRDTVGEVRRVQDAVRRSEGADSHLLRSRLREAVTDERTELLFAFVTGEIRRVLRLDDDVALEAPNRLLDLGLDSLMALELRRLLASGSGLAEDALSATLVFDYPTVGALVAHLDSEFRVDHVGATPSPAVEEPAETPALPRSDVAEMSDAEVEALLLHKLNELR